MQAPSGYAQLRDGPLTLFARADLMEAATRAGLGRSETWKRLCAAALPGSGRGRIARFELEGRRVVLKQLRRGGLAAAFWRDRFPGTARPLANLEVPREAARLGVPTALPVALLLRRGPPGLFQAWLATVEIEDASDLLALFRATPPPNAALIGAVLDRTRLMHDAGLVHPDLNLGNFLARQRPDGSWEVFVVDLDGARIRPGPLGFRERQSSLRRLERSAVKHFGDAGPPGAGPPSSWYTLYAQDDAQLARRLEAGRLAGRIGLAMHRAGWSDGDGGSNSGSGPECGGTR